MTNTRSIAVILLTALLPSCGGDTAPDTASTVAGGAAGSGGSGDGDGGDSQGGGAGQGVAGKGGAGGGGKGGGAGKGSGGAGQGGAGAAQGGAGAGQGGAGAGGNDHAAIDAGIISTVSGKGEQSESHVAVAPGGRAVAAWIELGGKFTIGYAISEDRGATWGAPANVSFKNLGDAVVAGRKDGTLLVGGLGGTCQGGACSQGHVWIAALPPGASALAPEVDVSPGDPAEFYDKPWLMTAHDGTSLVTYAARAGQYPDNDDRLEIARSTDGVSWTRATIFDPPQGNLAGIPHSCTSRNSGRTWVLHVDSQSPTFASMRWSDAAGLTWPATSVSHDWVPISDAAQLQGYDLRCAGEGDQVWVMYGLASGPSSSTSIPPIDTLRVVRSQDGGKTWGAPITLNDPGELLLRPEIIVEPSGAIDVTAYRGASADDKQGSVVLRRSTDGGASFGPWQTLHAPINFTGDRSSARWIGDYSGLTFDDGDLFVTYADNITGTTFTGFSRRPAAGP